MKKILIISNYWHFPFERSSSRYNTIIELLSKKNEVELITSNFRHSSKTHRNYSQDMFKSYNYKVTFIDEPGYKKNVSLKRIYSHKIFSNNLIKYLNRKRNIDIIYSFVPSLSSNIAILKYIKKNQTKYFIDILDLWPEAFKMAFDVPIISNLLFFPMIRQANKIYSNADGIIAVSETYAKRALNVNKKNSKAISVYLGIDLKYFDDCRRKNNVIFHDDVIRIVYMGTLGYSYNIKLIIDAIAILLERKKYNIKFVVIGDGPLKNNFQEYAKEKKIACEFCGQLDYPKMVGLLCACDIAVNPIISKSVSSIINKVGDYAAAGLPVINTQNSFEYRILVNKYNAGFNCDNDDINDIVDKFEILINKSTVRKKLGRGNRKLAEDKFDRENNYKLITDLIERG